jgi:hypothetical protein
MNYSCFNLKIKYLTSLIKYTLKKKLTHFAKKSSEIIISSRTAGSTLQNRLLLYKTQKN